MQCTCVSSYIYSRSITIYRWIHRETSIKINGMSIGIFHIMWTNNIEHWKLYLQSCERDSSFRIYFFQMLGSVSLRFFKRCDSVDGANYKESTVRSFDFFPSFVNFNNSSTFCNHCLSIFFQLHAYNNPLINYKFCARKEI